MSVASSQFGPPALTNKNFANLAAYGFNVLVTYLSITGIFGETNTDLSKKYQTLVTPAGWAFSIWGPIFIWEGAFTVAQMTPTFRNSAFVKAMAPWWWATCLFQVVWSLAFAQELITLAFVCMLCILVSLLGLLYHADTERGSVAEYWLLRAPFALHAGWIIAASAVNINVEADAMKSSESTMLSVAIVSFVAVGATVCLVALAFPLPNPIVCFVGFWAFMGIHAELDNAKNLLNPAKFNPIHWDHVVLSGVSGAALALSTACLVWLALAASLRIRRVPMKDAAISEERGTPLASVP